MIIAMSADIVRLAKRYLHGPGSSLRAGFYLVVTVVVSLLSDQFDMASSGGFFADPHNFLNQYFVKLGWAWTFFPVGGFILLSSVGRDVNMSVSRIVLGVARLFIGTLVWYSVTQVLFPTVEHKTGLCQVTDYPDKAHCARAGFRWEGFDTSGHCFLLVWNNLFIIEEAFLGWRRVEKEEGKSGVKRQSETRFESCNRFVEWSFVLLACLVVLWDLMIFNTMMYFHTVAEKVLGCAIAIVLWCLLYKVLYRIGFSQHWGSGSREKTV